MGGCESCSRGDKANATPDTLPKGWAEAVASLEKEIDAVKFKAFHGYFLSVNDMLDRAIARDAELGLQTEYKEWFDKLAPDLESKAFTAYDANGDGYLDQKEYTSFIRDVNKVFPKLAPLLVPKAAKAAARFDRWTAEQQKKGEEQIAKGLAERVKTYSDFMNMQVQDETDQIPRLFSQACEKEGSGAKGLLCKPGKLVMQLHPRSFEILRGMGEYAWNR